jgi:hypothetical protein
LRFLFFNAIITRNIEQENGLMKGGGNNQNRKDETNDGTLSGISSGKDGVLLKDNM